MTHAQAILWAQWRSLRNFHPKRGVAWTAVVATIWYGLWSATAVALAKIFSESDSVGMIHKVLPSGLLIVVMYWQLIPLLMATTGSSLELRKLRSYPIPESQLFSIEVLLRVTSGVEMVLLLAGIGVGVALNPALPHWGVLAILVYALLNLFAAVGFRDMLARVLARKRIREAAFFLLILAAAMPQLLLTRRGPGTFRMLALLGGQPWWGFPWTAASRFIEGSQPLQSAAILGAWTLAAFAFSRWQFSRTLVFDASAVGATRSNGSAKLDAKAEKGAARAGFMERFYRLPSVLLRDPMGALIEKEFRFLLRAPRFRLVFLMGFTFGLLIWLPMAVGYGGYHGFGPISDRGITPFFFRNYLTVVSVYSLLLLSEICFWNAFGFDRSAAQFYFLAPVKFTRVIVAKNVTALFFIALEIAAVTTVCAILGLPLGAARLAEAFGVAGVVSLFLLSAGNLHSIRNARGVNPANSFRSGAAGRIQAMLFIIYPIAFSPIILAFLARYAFDSERAFFLVLAADAVLGFILYRVGIDAAASTADRMKEQMVADLSTGDSPISD